MKENIELWVKALRSGKYVQGTNCLKDGDRFCCLGVACDVYRNNVENAPEWNEYNYYFEEGLTLPIEVALWLGISPNPIIPTYGFLADLNDAGVNFLSIANMIEEAWLKENE